MIIVVEGPSGAGKTTWCRTHVGANALLEALPDHATVPTEPQAAARFALNMLFYVLGFGLFVLGTVVVFTFDPSRWPGALTR